ncbi:MAG TPA: hypothetical protein VGS97_11135 [Actinocrinis sp.]|uniref:hypothetical protein n=1 Tax=Actinocrinis sp. TaxID=1920516 RepID=UPI002DDDA7A3|nr:hypothetical protein [Actinocrinis sp.]HEV2344638.1 hypothetical protein [Actinocrinis sp.]
MTDRTAASQASADGESLIEPAAPAGPDSPPQRVTILTEFIRVLRTRPDWLYGMLSSWMLGVGTYAFLLVFTRPNLADPMNQLVVPVILTAVADGSLTNQLAAEPRWLAGILRSGTDPGRILLARNIVLALWELFFVGLVVAATVLLGHDSAWVGPALPQLAVLPIASIAIGNLASVLVPCPFMRMSKRFQAVGTWARWMIYAAIPWALSSIALAMWALPVYLEGRWEPRVVTHVINLKHYAVTVQHATHTYFMIWLIVIPLWHLTVWLLSLRLAQAFARVRRRRLVRLMDQHLQLTARLPDLSLVAAARQLPARVREIPGDLRGELSLISSEIMEATTTMTRL